MTSSLLPIVVPDGVSGEWRVETFTITDEESDRSRMRAAFGHPDEFVYPGTYKRLMRGRTVVMSNTPFEARTNRSFITAATGNVLINGLGLGMVLTAILAKEEVASVTVIEKSNDVVSLVGPSFAQDLRVQIILADAMQYRPDKGIRFDAVWHDIWDYSRSDNLSEMRKLKRRYSKISDWQGCWCERECGGRR